jgi:hypothetical protein
VMMKFAPPMSFPFSIHSCRNSIELALTISLIFNIFDMNSGTMTWLGCKLGSGEMTVLAVKLDLLPERFCLNLPCFPFSLVQNDRINLFLSSKTGRPGASVFIYWLQCDWRRYQALLILPKSYPLSIMVSFIFLFRNIISFIFIVKSSSFDKLFVNMTLGLIQTGGTIRWSMIRLFIEVYPPMLTRMSCFFGILPMICLASQGLSSTGSYWLCDLSADSITPLLIFD